jgi:flagellar biosynthetic protein FliQ
LSYPKIKNNNIKNTGENMDSSFVTYLGRHTFETALLLSAPVLGTCMIVGVVVTLLQAVTSIRDMTLTIVPKLIAVGVVIIICANWMLQILLGFSNEIFSYIQNIGH